MGVIKRFAIWSMVLGSLAIAGGASALAFEGGSDTQMPAEVPAQVQSAPVENVAPALADHTQDWAASHNIAYDPTPID